MGRETRTSRLRGMISRRLGLRKTLKRARLTGATIPPRTRRLRSTNKLRPTRTSRAKTLPSRAKTLPSRIDSKSKSSLYSKARSRARARASSRSRRSRSRSRSRRRRR